MTGTGIDNYNRPGGQAIIVNDFPLSGGSSIVDFGNSCRLLSPSIDNSDHGIIHRFGKIFAVNYHFIVKYQDRWLSSLKMVEIIISPLPQNVPKKDCPLESVDKILFKLERGGESNLMIRHFSGIHGYLSPYVWWIIQSSSSPHSTQQDWLCMIVFFGRHKA
jgi:hypothetical protein